MQHTKHSLFTSHAMAGRKVGRGQSIGCRRKPHTGMQKLRARSSRSSNFVFRNPKTDLCQGALPDSKFEPVNLLYVAALAISNAVIHACMLANPLLVQIHKVLTMMSKSEQSCG